MARFANARLAYASLFCLKERWFMKIFCWCWVVIQVKVSRWPQDMNRSQHLYWHSSEITLPNKETVDTRFNLKFLNYAAVRHGNGSKRKELVRNTDYCFRRFDYPTRDSECSSGSTM